MQRVSIVTDSTAGLPPEVAAELGIALVPASFAFAEERHLDGAIPWPVVYDRMTAQATAPRTFGVAESAFRTAFEAGLKRAETVLGIVSPFGVNPSFTTACAAMLAIQFDQPEAKIKVLNAGVGSAGLGALLMSLAGCAKAGTPVEQLLSAIDDLEPRAESLFVPADLSWLSRTGKLQILEERLGPVVGRIPIVRVGTRITGVALAERWDEAIGVAVEKCGGRAGGANLNVSIVHANAESDAANVAKLVRSAWPVSRLEITGLSATHGAELGPGAVGIGTCPVMEPKE